MVKRYIVPALCILPGNWIIIISMMVRLENQNRTLDGYTISSINMLMRFSLRYWVHSIFKCNRD